MNMFIIFRFGILAFLADQVVFLLLLLFPITAQLSAWYSGIGITGFALLLAFALYAFYTSLGGRPVFGTPRFDE